MESEEFTFKNIYADQLNDFLKAKKHLKISKNKSLHEIRVVIKHLKIYSQFIDRFLKTSGHSEKILKQLKPIFKNAGKIRTILINLKSTQSVAACKSYVHHLNKSLKKAKHDLRDAEKTFRTNSFKKDAKKINEVLEKFKSQGILDECGIYIAEKEDSIHKTLKQKITTEKLHEIRKDLKIIKALKKISDDIKGEKSSKVKINKLTQLEETIGKWHDKVALLEDLEKYFSGHKAEEQLKEFINKLRKEVLSSQNHSVLLLKKQFQ